MQKHDNFDRFCVMIDCSRNAVPNIDFLKTYIADIAKMGYNSIQLYTEDTYEIDGEPFFGYLRGRFTKNDLIEINAYAKTLGVEVIPCIQTLAHLNTLLRWDAYSDVHNCRYTLLCNSQKTYELIDKMFKTMRECFDSNYINIGMDEAPFVNVGKYLKLNGYKDKNELLVEHLTTVCEIAKKYDFTPIMWSDMWFSVFDGGHRSDKPYNFSDDLLKKVPDNICLCYWDYYTPNLPIFENMLNSHKKFDREIWFAGSVWSSRGFAPCNLFAMRTHATNIDLCIKHGVKNFIITCWGDDGAESSRLSTYSSLFHAICVAKGITDIKTIDEMFFNLFGLSLNDHAKLDLPNLLEAQYDAYNIDIAKPRNPSKYMFYQDPFMGIYDFTYNKDSEKYFAIHRDELKKFIGNKKFGYVYDTLYKLCDVLTIKYGIGVKTRTAYKAKDKKALKQLIKDYKSLIVKIEAFYKAFKTQWLIENISIGFEVCDQRFGGLIKRVTACKDTLIDYVKGKIDVILDLEQEILPDNKDGTIGKMILTTDQSKIISANVVKYPELN